MYDISSVSKGVFVKNGGLQPPPPLPEGSYPLTSSFGTIEASLYCIFKRLVLLGTKAMVGYIRFLKFFLTRNEVRIHS